MTTPAPRSSGIAIRWRLTLWIALAFLVTLSVVFAAAWLATNEIFNDDIEEEIDRNFLAIETEVLFRGEENIDNYPYPVVLIDPDGSIIAASPTADVPAMQLSDEELRAVTIERQTLEENVEISGEEYRMRSERILRENGTVAIAQVASNIQTIQDLREVLTRIFIGGIVIALVVVLGVGYWLARNALRPIESVTRMAGEIGASDLTRRLAVNHKPAEVQQLADTFDGMLARLESAFAQQRNFVMDVSHELRTPLTALRGNLDVLLMDPALDPETREQLERMSAEVARLIRLTSNLLYLAHAEAGREVARRPVELDSLCLEVVHQARNIRPDVNVRLGNEEQLTVAGDRDLLKQLVLNLVDNAIKYSPPGGEVVLSLAQASGAAEIVVEDSGPGIPGEQLDQIFERYYRGDNSGSRTVGGAGIGLAISKWIADAHGGAIRVESDVGHGTRFTVTLPLSEQPVPAVTP